MRENRDLTVSDKHTQSSRDSSTISISDNSATRESIPGITPRIMTDTPSTPNTPSIPTAFSVETDVIDIPEEEIQMHSSNYRSVIPTDIQALTALQSLVSDDFQVKNTHSTQRKEKRLQIHIQIHFYSKKRRRYTRWDIPTDPGDPQSTPASPMGSSKAPFIT